MTQERIELLNSVEYGTLSLVDGVMPYSVALNFVYLDGFIYFHCGKKGKKIDILKQNSNCFFSVVKDYSLIASYFSSKSGLACPATHFFESIHIEGKVEFVDSTDEKIEMFTALMQKLQKEGGYKSFDSSDYKGSLDAVEVVKIKILNHTHKVKVGQKLSQDRFDMIIENLQKRGEKIDLETVEKMRGARDCD